MHRLSLFSPAGLADGLALKELRYVQLERPLFGTLGSARFAPGRTANWFPHAPLPGGASAWIDAAMLAAQRTLRTEKAPQAAGVSVTAGRASSGDYWPATL